MLAVELVSDHDQCRDAEQGEQATGERVEEEGDGRAPAFGPTPKSDQEEKGK